MSPKSSKCPAPYPRRTSGQPKSTRQQFSACGACRVRRVKCDLKDLQPDPSRPHPTCSNCKERGIKCVDEFAEVKAVKLLRRGRRLQQVEAMYGRSEVTEHPSPSTSSAPFPHPQSVIPPLQIEFFNSPFWARFMMQRPILDPTEFPARFFAHNKGTHSFGNEACLIAMLLVVWAASFGVDERGVEEADSDQLEERDAQREMIVGRRRRETQQRTYSMVREVLGLIDAYGVMRQPTWDGVRVLLLVLPLMHDVQPPLDRLIVYEATLSQIHALSTASSLPSGSYTSDALVKARVFWYAYTHEGMSSGLRGSRLVLDGEDLDNFQRMLPSFVGIGNGPTPSHPSPTSPTFSPNSPPLTIALVPHEQQELRQQPPPQRSPGQSSYLSTAPLFALPLLLSGVCRKVHAVLTGRRAQARARANGAVDIMADGLRDIWDRLDRCWEGFDALRRNGGICRAEDETEKYIGGWQIFIFECHNIIRLSLKQLILSNSPPGSTSSPVPAPSPNPSRPSPHSLHASATRKCMRMLPSVIRIIKMHVATDNSEGSGLFRWDAGLVRHGCFFAGYLASGGESQETADGVDEFPMGRDFEDEGGSAMGPDECVEVCLMALSEMRWAFSKAEEREHTVKMMWGTRRMRGRPMREYREQLDIDGDRPMSEYHQSPQPLSPYGDHAPLYSTKSLHHSQAHAIIPLASDRPPLPPLSLTFSPQSLVDSGSGSPPSTAYTEGSDSGWPVYTPPGTATSGSGSGMSGHGGSPGYSGSAMQTFVVKTEAVDFYQHTGVSLDLNPFSFNAGAEGIVTAGYHQTQGHGQVHTAGGGSGYRDAGVVFCGTEPSVMAHPGVHGPSGGAFAEDCGFYH